MAVLDGTPQSIAEGTWNIQVETTNGTVAVYYATGSLDPILLDGGSFAKSEGNNFRLPACNIHAVLTGDAVAEINTVGG